MEQVIFGGRHTPLDPTTTKYNTLVGSDLDWQSSETFARVVVSSDGKIKNLRVKLTGSPGIGKEYVFTLMVNGAPSALTLTISDAETSDADTTHEVDVSPGDTVSLECNPDGTPTVRDATWTSMFEGDTAKESLVLGKGKPSSFATSYIPLGVLDTTGTATSVQVPCPTSGKLKNFYVSLSAAPGGGKSLIFTLLVNGIESTLTVTIADTNTTGNDVAHEVDVSVGDRLIIKCVSDTFTPIRDGHGFTFLADIDGESLMLNSSNVSLSTADTQYNNLQGAVNTPWDITESEHYQLGQACSLKKLYVLLDTAPGDDKSYTFTLRKPNPGNGMMDGNLTVTITGAAVTTGNDTVNEDAIADDDYVDLECTPAGTPAVAKASWGLVCFIGAPAVGLENKSANMGSKMVAAGLI